MIPLGQHVMLSYNAQAEQVVAEISRILQSRDIRVWFDKRGDVRESIYDKYVHQCVSVL